MARRRKSRRSSRRRSRRSASHVNAPRRRRSHRGHRRARRSRRYHGNPGPGMWKDMIMAVLAGGAGYIASRKASDVAEHYLPGMVPMRELVGPALVAAAIIAATEKFVRDPKLRIAAQGAACIPLVEAIVNKAGLGRALGTEHFIMLPHPAPGAPGAAPAALQANLMAQLEDGYTSEY